MNNERFNELIAKAERAKKLADEIKALDAADIYGDCLVWNKRSMSGDSRFDPAVLGDICRRGIASLRAEKMAELESILGPEPMQTVDGLEQMEKLLPLPPEPDKELMA